MTDAERIEVIRRFYEAGPPDDDSERGRFAAPDVVWHVPGHNPVAGLYRGHDEVFRTIGERMQPLDEWRIVVRDVMSNDALVLATVSLVARRGDVHVESEGGHVFRFDERDRIVEVWGFVAEQEALDLLFATGAVNDP